MSKSTPATEDGVSAGQMPQEVARLREDGLASVQRVVHRAKLRLDPAVMVISAVEEHHQGAGVDQDARSHRP
jgi:hypothetical protein